MTSGAKFAIREALLWIAVIASAFFSVFYYDEIERLLFANESSIDQVLTIATQTKPDAQVAQPDRFAGHVTLYAEPNGHYFTDAHINGKPVPVVVDTGATLVSLTYEDAERTGLAMTDDDFKFEAKTANGIAKVARVTLDRVRIGDITIRDVEALVSEKGKAPITLLGMSFLNKIKSVNLANGQLVLTN